MRRIPGWKARSAVVFLLFLIQVSCSVNILEALSDPTTDEALLYDAKMLINARDYNGALGKFSAMSAATLAKRDVKKLYASAYAGLCGLDFLDLMDAISNMGATKILMLLMQTFSNGDSTKQAACISAETQIKSIDPQASQRTADENLLMSFVAFAKLGTILSRYGDSSPANGTVDAGFDPCVIGSIPSADAKEIATGINIAMDSLQNIGSSTIGSSVVSSFTTACASLGTFCAPPAQVNTGQIDALEEKAARSLVNESSAMGLGVCTGDVVACACP